MFAAFVFVFVDSCLWPFAFSLLFDVALLIGYVMFSIWHSAFDLCKLFPYTGNTKLVKFNFKFTFFNIVYFTVHFEVNLELIE